MLFKYLLLKFSLLSNASVTTQVEFILLMGGKNIFVDEKPTDEIYTSHR